MEKKQIFTSYFANLKNLPDWVEPIAICGGNPDWYKGKSYKRLAPSWPIWKEWHDSTDLDKDKHYTRRFINEIILGRLGNDLQKVILDIQEFSEDKTPCLICYEKPKDFCHRHLIADWLNSSGIVECSEF